MLSFQSLYQRCAKDAGDTNNNQFFKDTINEGAKVTENELDNFVVEDMRTGNTIAGFNQIPSPENYIRAKFLYVTSGVLRYDAKFVYSEDAWQGIVASQANIQSNMLTHAFPRPDYIELFPKPSSILTYTLQYVSEYRDMQFDDVTGLVVSITNTAPLVALPFATVIGNGTSWTANMAGRYFKMNGDNQWYKITSVTDTTHLVLGKAYAGLLSSNIPQLPNLNYTIAEMPRLPEASHMLLYYYALKEYFAGPKKDAANFKKFSDLYDKWLGWAKGTFAGRMEMGVIPSQRSLRGRRLRNPNLFPQSIG